MLVLAISDERNFFQKGFDIVHALVVFDNLI